jgi:DNA-binding MarR family transcriptional regulator
MNRYAHLGNAVRPRRRPATAEGVYEVSSFRPFEAVGHLTARVRQTLGDALKKQFASLGATLARCIAIIGKRSDMASTIAETCKGTSCDPGSMTRTNHLDRLEYVRSERSTKGRRVLKLVLTEHGRAAYAQVIEPGIRTLDGHLRGFSKQEVRQLEADLQQALANAWAQKF